MRKYFWVLVHLVFLIQAGFPQGDDPFEVRTRIDMYSPTIRDFTDITHPDEVAELQYKPSASHVYETGTAVLTFPPEIEVTGWLVRYGMVKSLTYDNKVLTILFDKDDHPWDVGTNSGAEIWIYVKTKPLEELSDIGNRYVVSGTFTAVHSTAGSATTVDEYPFFMQQARPVVESTVQGTVTEDDVISYNVSVSTTNWGKGISSTLTLDAPNGTDLVEGSLTGVPGTTATQSGNRYTLTWGEDPPTTVTASYQVKVRKIFQIGGDVKSIDNTGVSYRFKMESEHTSQSGVVGHYDRTLLTTAPTVSNKLERAEFEVTLDVDKPHVDVDEEFTLLATIKSKSIIYLEEVKLAPSSIVILGDLAVELIESPAEFPSLNTGAESTLEYTFKALEKGQCKVTAIAQGTYAGSGMITTSDPAVSPEICVDCEGLDLSLFWINRSRTGTLKIGEEVGLRLLVTAPDGLEGEYTDLSFDDPLLEFPDIFEVVDEPTHFEVGTLEAGDRFAFDWKLIAKKAGEFDLVTSDISGKDNLGKAFTQGGAELEGSINGFDVAIIFPEEPLKLVPIKPEDGESGDPTYEPLEFDIRIHVSVPKDGQAIKDVTLQGWNDVDGGISMDRVESTGIAEMPWVDVMLQPVPFPITLKTQAPIGTYPQVLSPEGPGVDFVVTMVATKPGNFDFSALITAANVAGGNVVTERGSKVAKLYGDILLTLKVEILNEVPRITEGESVHIAGTVKNISLTDTVVLFPIQTFSSGQGIVLGPVPQDDPLPLPGRLGFFDPILTPEKDDTFRVSVKTVSLPGFDQREMGRTSVILDFGVSGKVIDEEGQARDLEEHEILVEWGKGKFDNEGGTFLRAQVDADLRENLILDPDDFFFISAGKSMEQLVAGGGEAIVGIPQMLSGLYSGTIGIANSAGAYTVEKYIASHNFSRYMWAWFDWQTDVWLGIESETRRQEFQIIADELFYYYGDKFESVEQVYELVNTAITSYFVKGIEYGERSYDAAGYGFNEEFATIMTEPMRPVGKLVVEDALTNFALLMWFGNVARSERIANEVVQQKELFIARSREQAAEATEAVARRGDAGDPRLVEMPDAMKALPASTPILKKEAMDGFGIDSLSDDNLIKMTNVDEGGMPIIVAIRSRADETVEWMNTPLGVTPKPMPFKPKNVNPDDVNFLGYRDGVGYGDANGVGAGDRGATLIAEPIPRDEVLRRLEGYDDVTRQRVLDRHNLRWDEWYGVDWPGVPDIIDSSVSSLRSRLNFQIVNGKTVGKGTLDVPKRGSVPQPDINQDVVGPGVLEARKFEMRQVVDPPDNHLFEGGREYLECWLEDDIGALRRIAGDIDIVAVTDATGGALKVASEFTETVAKNLQHGISAQHPWSSSLGSKKLFDKYINAHRWNKDITKRGEPLLLYVNGERRIGWFHPTRVITSENPLEGFMWLDGGTGDIDDVVRFQQDLRGSLPNPAKNNPPHVKPATTSVRAALINADANTGSNHVASCLIQPSRSGGNLYRLSQNNIFERRKPDGSWEETDPATECGDSGILVMPETFLSTDIVAGTLRLPILESLLGLDWRETFRIGDNVIIGAGTPEEEEGIIASHGSIILREPVKFDHPMGTSIALLPIPGAAEPPPIRVQSFNQSVQDNGQLGFEIEFRSISERFVFFEQSNDMINWEPANISTILGGEFDQGLVSIANLGDPVFMTILADSTTTSSGAFFRFRNQ